MTREHNEGIKKNKAVLHVSTFSDIRYTICQDILSLKNARELYVNYTSI